MDILKCITYKNGYINIYYSGLKFGYNSVTGESINSWGTITELKKFLKIK